MPTRSTLVKTYVTYISDRWKGMVPSQIREKMMSDRVEPAYSNMRRAFVLR